MRYGTVVRISPGELSFASLNAAKIIYGVNTKAVQKSKFYHVFENNGIVPMAGTVNNNEHAEQRRLVNSIYSMSSVMRMGVVEEKMELLLDLLRSAQGPVEMFGMLHFYAMDVISKICYGSEGETDMLNTTKWHKLSRDICHAQRAHRYFFEGTFPGLMNFIRAMNPLLSRIHMALPHRKSSSAEYGEAAARLSMVESAHDEDTVMQRLLSHKNLSRDYISSEVLDHFLAGSDTTANTLAYSLWLLSKRQDLQAELRSQLRGSLEYGPNGLPADIKTLVSHPYLDAFVRECLRLYGAIPSSLKRTACDDLVIEEYHVPRGTDVSVQIYTINRNKDIFADPNEFNPARWLQDAGSEELKAMKFGLFSFGQGARNCIGQHVAMLEMKYFLSTVYHHFSTALAPSCTDEGMFMQDEITSMCPAARTTDILFAKLD